MSLFTSLVTITSEEVANPKMKEIVRKFKEYFCQPFDRSSPPPSSPPRKGMCQLPIEFRQPNGKFINKYWGIVGSAAEISLIHYHLLKEIPVTLYSMDIEASDINGPMELLGFCYLLLKAKGSNETRLMKFYVAKELTSPLILGTDFIDEFLHLIGPGPTFILGGKDNGLVNPTLILKPMYLDVLTSTVNAIGESIRGGKHPIPWALFPGNHQPPRILNIDV